MKKLILVLMLLTSFNLFAKVQVRKDFINFIENWAAPIKYTINSLTIESSDYVSGT